MAELTKPDLERLLQYYDYDTSYLSAYGWSRRRIKCLAHEPDTHPSMTVNLEECRVKCWSCGFNGDGYDVIQLKEGFDGLGKAKEWARDHLGTQVQQVHKAPARSRYVPSWADGDGR